MTFLMGPWAGESWGGLKCCRGSLILETSPCAGIVGITEVLDSCLSGARDEGCICKEGTALIRAVLVSWKSFIMVLRAWSALWLFLQVLPGLGVDFFQLLSCVVEQWTLVFGSGPGIPAGLQCLFPRESTRTYKIVCSSHYPMSSPSSTSPPQCFTHLVSRRVCFLPVSG